jgi:hypothetical protein
MRSVVSLCRWWLVGETVGVSAQLSTLLDFAARPTKTIANPRAGPSIQGGGT